MEISAQTKPEYDQFLALYSKKRSQNDAEEKAMKEINLVIVSLQLELHKLDTHPVISTFKINELQEKQFSQLTLKAKELMQQLKLQEEESQNQSSLNQKVVMKQLNKAHSQLKLRLQQLHDLSLKTKEKFDNSTSIFTDIHKQKNLQQRNWTTQEIRVCKIRQDLSKQQKEVTELQKQLQVLQSKHNEQPNLISKDTNEQKTLQDQIDLLEREYNQIQSNLHQQKQQKLINKHSDETLKQSQQQQLTALKNINSKLINEKSKAEKQLVGFTYNQKEKILSLEGKIHTLSEKNKIMKIEIESCQKSINDKRVEEQKKKEQQNSKKTKEKGRNFRQEIIQAQKQNEIYIKELEREHIKLTDTSKLRKSYVSSENLQILQKQFERHHANNRPSLVIEDIKKEKLLKENQILKSRIQFLKKSSKQLEDDSQNRMKEVKMKGDELVNQKLVHQKLLNQVTCKLNDYMKQFPDHEKRKEEKKNQEKRLRQELKEKQRERIKRQKEGLKTEQKHIIADSTQSEEKGQNSNQTAWEKWDQWDREGKLGSRDQTSIFNRWQFQMACGVVALVTILVLIFGV